MVALWKGSFPYCSSRELVCVHLRASAETSVLGWADMGNSQSAFHPLLISKGVFVLLSPMYPEFFSSCASPACEIIQVMPV